MQRLVSLHLSNDRILWGHVLLEDTENPDAHLAQILVRAIDVEPGYELYDKTNTVLSDLSVPAVREANRIVQTLLIPASEIAKREKAVRAVKDRVLAAAGKPRSGPVSPFAAWKVTETSNALTLPRVRWRSMKPTRSISGVGTPRSLAACSSSLTTGARLRSSSSELP
jgi:hypothetical protein